MPRLCTKLCFSFYQGEAKLMLSNLAKRLKRECDESVLKEDSATRLHPSSDVHENYPKLAKQRIVRS